MLGLDGDKPENEGDVPVAEAKTKEIKIHLGFMPEEVASVLKPIINNRMGTDAAAQTPDNESVIIISRGDIKDDLFEQFVSNFGIQKYDEVSSTLQADPGSPAICEKIASTLGQFLDGADLQASLIVGAKTKMQEHMSGGRPNISVGRIGTGPVTRICIQLPEMGFQSDLAAVYTMGMIDAIAKHALDPTIPVTVSSYGAGGSAHEDLVPGQMNNCDAVLNLRTHIDLTPQVDHLQTVIQSLGRPDLNSELNTLQAYSERLANKDAGVNHNVLQRDLIGIRNNLIAKGVPAESLKLPKDHDTQYYTEIAISNPIRGKIVFYKTASFTDRAIAEEAAHLMLLNFGKTETPNLTTGYINFLKQSNPEYRQLVEACEKSDKGAEIIQKFVALDSELVQKFKDKLEIEIEISNIRSQLGVANVSLRSSLKYTTPDSVLGPKEIADLKQKRTTLEESRNKLEERILELTAEMHQLETLSVQYPVDEQAKAAVEEFHKEEIKKLQILGQNGYFAQEGLSETRFMYSSDAEDSAIFADVTRKYLMDTLALDTEGFSHNFAASMFIGAQTKEAVKNLTEGQVIADVNMEDDIVADIIHMVITRKIGNEEEIGMNMRQFSMARVHCDPFTITHQVEEQFQAWCKDKKVSNSYYVDAVMWGLKGFSADGLTATAKWDFVDKLKSVEPKIADVDKLFFEHNGVVVDPFWREIGTDFLADIKNGKAIPFTIAERNTLEVQALLDKLKAESESISVLMRNGTPEEDVKSKVAGLVTAVLSHPKMKMFNEKGNNYGIWARIGSWGGNPQANVSQISFNGSSIDRAFYVSSNMNALTKGGQEIVADRTKKQVLDSDMIVRYREPKSQASSISMTRANQTLTKMLERIEYYKNNGESEKAFAAAKQSLKWAKKQQNVLDKQLLDQIKIAAQEPVVAAPVAVASTPSASSPTAPSTTVPTNGASAPIAAAPAEQTTRKAVTYGRVYRHGKVSGPKELERLKSIQDPAARAQEAQHFINWAQKHNRHFNPPAMAEIRKMAAEVKVEHAKDEVRQSPK